MNESIAYYFEKYLSDKNVNGYSPVYDEIFASRRNKGTRLLEIGIGTLQPTNSNMLFWKDNHITYEPGASLRAFRDYFVNGTIYGIDIQPDCLFKEYRIETFLCDSTNKLVCDHYFGEKFFHFIIDDGDHYWESQIKTFENFFDKLFPGGVYILEDLAYPDEIKKYFETTTHNYEFRNGLLIIYK